jgi:hypothetical protein
MSTLVALEKGKRPRVWCLRRQLEAGIDPSAVVVKTTAVEIGST